MSIENPPVERLTRGSTAPRSAFGEKIDRYSEDPLIKSTRESIVYLYGGKNIEVSATFRPFLQAIKKLFGHK